MENQAHFTSTRFVLSVLDLEESAEYYRDKLGFEDVWSGEGWHFVKRGNCFIMLGECPNDVSAKDISTHSYFAYILVDHIDDFYASCKEKEVEIIMDIASRDWGMREFGIRTVDGHRIMFGSPWK